MIIDVHHYIHLDDQLAQVVQNSQLQSVALLQSISKQIAELKQMEKTIMVSVQDIQDKATAELAQITAETDVVNAVKLVVENQNAKLADVQAQLAALVAAGTATPEQLQSLSDTFDAIKAADTANAAVVAAAVAAGTPASPAAPTA